MRVRFTVHYRCMGCDHEWREKRTEVKCRKCGSLYVEWVNFKEVRRRGFRD